MKTIHKLFGVVGWIAVCFLLFLSAEKYISGTDKYVKDFYSDDEQKSLCRAAGIAIEPIRCDAPIPTKKSHHERHHAKD